MTRKSDAKAPEFVYVGSSTPDSSGEATGITLLIRDPIHGYLRKGQRVDEEIAASFLARHPVLPVIYVATGRGDMIFSFRVTGSGDLSPMGSAPAGGADPCYLSLDTSGRHLYVSNYLDGKLVVHRLEDDGSLGSVTQVCAHRGGGPNAERQSGPHVHSAVPAPGGRYVLAADLGCDAVVVYRVTPSTGRLDRVVDARGDMAPGAGPRHLLFGPHNEVFATCELSSTVALLRLDQSTGALEAEDECSATSVATISGNSPSDLAISHDAKFLYVANRGAQVITVVSRDVDGSVPWWTCRVVGESHVIWPGWDSSFTLRIREVTQSHPSCSTR